MHSQKQEARKVEVEVDKELEEVVRSMMMSCNMLR